LIGKKFSSKTRKELYSISSKIKIAEPSCERQFDNIRAIFRLAVGDDDKDEDEPPNCAVETMIQRQFLLPTDLAKAYARIVFLMRHRVQTSKNKRLSDCTFQDLQTCAQILMDVWGRADRFHDELDIAFIEQLRGIRSKVLADRKTADEYCAAICKHVVQHDELLSKLVFDATDADADAANGHHADADADADADVDVDGNADADGNTMQTDAADTTNAANDATSIDKANNGNADIDHADEKTSIGISADDNTPESTTPQPTPTYHLNEPLQLTPPIPDRDPEFHAKVFSKLPERIASVCKVLLQVAVGLAKKKDIRNLLSLLEESVRPLSKLEFHVDQIGMIFIAMQHNVQHTAASVESQQLWGRFLAAVAPICVVLYQACCAGPKRSFFARGSDLLWNIARTPELSSLSLHSKLEHGYEGPPELNIPTIQQLSQNLPSEFQFTAPALNKMSP
jgi:Acidic fibroblast growth factor binding (FIBP)